MTAWVDICTLTHVSGCLGRLVAHPTAGLPSLLREGLEVYPVPPLLEAPRRLTVTEVKPHGKDWLVGFAELHDRTDAAAYEGLHCLAAKDDLPPSAWTPAHDSPAGADWLGWSVIDVTHGPVGTVREVQPRPGQPLLVVEDEAGAETLIPVVDEFLVDCREAQRQLIVDVPAGLIELNGKRA